MAEPPVSVFAVQGSEVPPHPCQFRGCASERARPVSVIPAKLLDSPSWCRVPGENKSNFSPILEIRACFLRPLDRFIPVAKNKRRVIVKRIFHLNVRGFILAAAFSAGLGFGTSASAQYLVDLNSKTATELGTLG